MQKKDESLEQNPSTPSGLDTAELDSPPESGQVPRGQHEHAADVDFPFELDACASFFPTPHCLTDDEVLAFSEGRMSGSGQAAVEWHMGGCGSCQQLLQWAAWCCTAASRPRR